jgi:flagellar protein FlaF
MYALLYDEALDDSPKNCRERERMALERAIRLLEEAEAAGAGSGIAAEALSFLGKLWRAFIEDLMSPDNDLPDTLRRDLLSIGLWVVKESNLILCGHSQNFRGLAEVCILIRNGLK